MGQRNRRRHAWSFVALLGVLAAGLTVIGATPAAASSIGVYVGYADSARPDAVSFPTPWQGSPNTVFEGCQPVATCSYDAGAVRIVNNSASPVTVNAVAIHLSTCLYTGWPPAVLAPGADLIVTQLSSGVGDGCTGPSPDHMDLSDVGPGGQYSSSCVPDGLQASVEVTVNGTTTSYTDNGQILNTGGIDAAVCGTPNESIQWTTIGHAPCYTSALGLTPPTQSHPVLSTASLTATFTNSCGQPLSNVAVQLVIVSGPNQGQTFAGVTDANGVASFSYSSSTVGTDTLQASVTNPAGTIVSNSVTATWTLNFAPGGGAFVISDLKAIQAAPAYWWGAQWWKENPLSTGLAPASFKGYENSNSTPWCGQTWTTRPGNSSRPPRAVPAGTEMAVIVSSAISKRGPVISGDIVGIVLVKTNAGYGPNPGHRGTGTVEAVLCGQLPADTSATNAGNASTAASASGKLGNKKTVTGTAVASKPQATSLPVPASRPTAVGNAADKGNNGHGVKGPKARR